MNRKQRRAAKSNKQTEVSEMLNMFDKLPDECLACTKPFDKTNKEMVFTWNVVVRNEDTVRLYCPDCWNMARQVVEQYDKQNNGED